MESNIILLLIDILEYEFVSSEFLSSLDFGQGTDIRKALHSSPPFISTGVLKEETLISSIFTKRTEVFYSQSINAT